jgi:hypothetical protein
MRVPIDTTSIKFAAVGAAEPAHVFSTKAPKTDENGVPLYSVPDFRAAGGIKGSITIKVAGDVKGPSEFTLLRIVGLIGQTWEVGDNHGISFRAERVEVLRAAACCWPRC